MDKIILSGDRPTGKLHVGHYIGSIKRRVELQNSGEFKKIFIMVADAQALTDNMENPEKVRQNIIEVVLDYLACGKLDSDVSSEIIKGVADGCLQAGASLIGGETAEMPGFYTVGEYDIAGFAVGAVEEEEIVNGSNIEEGNAIIAISSSGPHSNGFSLIRKLFADLNEVYENKKIWEHLLTPTKIYVKSIQKLMESVKINGMAHITGGGLIENVPRTIPDGLCANIDKKKVEIHPIFKHEYFKKVTEDELWGTFNMGVGFVVIVKKEDVEKTIDILKENGENAYEIGYISKGENKLCLK